MSTLKFTFVALLGLYVLVGLLIYFFQEKLIFLPEKLPANFQYEFNYHFEELFIQSDDNAKLNALHFKTDVPEGLIVYFHGNAGSLERWGTVVEPFVQFGYDVLIVDYRGYGKSSGEKSKDAMLLDAEKIYQKALELSEEKSIILYGRSIGSSFACHLAGKHNPSKLVLESPFYSLAHVAKRVIPIYPVPLLLRFDFKNYQALRNASCPIYIFHGTEDDVVPQKSGRLLHESLDVQNATFVSIEGGGHNDLARFDSFWTTILDVLQEKSER